MKKKKKNTDQLMRQAVRRKMPPPVSTHRNLKKNPPNRKRFREDFFSYDILYKISKEVYHATDSQRGFYSFR